MTTNLSPATAVFQGELYLAYVNTANNEIFVSTSSDGNNFSSPGNVVASVASPTSPAIATSPDGSTLYIAYVQGGILHTTSSTNGINWTAPTAYSGPAGLVSLRPALGVFNNILYISAIAIEGGYENPYIVQYGATNWARVPGDEVDYQATSGVTMAEYNGQIFVSWTTSQYHTPVIAYSTDAFNFLIYNNTAFEIGGDPALVVYSSALYEGGRSNYSADNFWMSGTYDGTHWNAASQYGQTLTQSPALTVFNNGLFESEKSKSGTNIWVCK